MADTHADTSTIAASYYVPHPSPWPILGSVALFCMMAGAVAYLNDWAGAWAFLPGLAAARVACSSAGSTPSSARTSTASTTTQVDRSFRMGMMWFIFSEVMFFAAFFGALFYARMLAVPWIGGEGVQAAEQALPVEELRSRPGRPTVRRTSGGPRRRHLRSDPGLRPAGAQHR